ncbi:class F sortase [Agrococcus sp. SL85]|uniref:class F sortase n=1 Tax=Agrococcus sp. SL85 TaxID=2995141 RepID=UPI00226CA151|nr:class F sortase [Agrococcus sp. SL85]WAC66450.1 class F sortase [Agrococcus sp. SL85]
MSRTRIAALAVAALAAVAAIVVGVSLAAPSAPLEAAAPAPVASSPAADPTPSATPSAAPAAEVGRQDASIGARPAVDVDEPVAVRLPELDVDLSVVPVGVREDGQMDVPLLVSEAGWYRYGPAPGAEAGSAVLAAHVDSDRGPAPMAVLLDVAVGTEVEVETEAGEVLRFRIDEVQQLGKGTLPLDELFARDGEHRLRLITCAGEWDPVAQAYEDNVIATATQIG